LSGNETSLELKNGKIINDDKGANAANSMAFTQYSDSQSKSFAQKHTEAVQKAKAAILKRKLEEAKKKKMLDNAMATRTILPSENQEDQD
jgi:hypothetical protein